MRHQRQAQATFVIVATPWGEKMTMFHAVRYLSGRLLPRLAVVGCCGLLLLLMGCGEVAVNVLGCEGCPERCLSSNSGRGQCVECVNDKQCQSKTSPTGKCEKNKCICGSDDDCPQRRYCSQLRGCVECVEDKHCTAPERPTCGLDNHCAECRPKEIQACAPKDLDVCAKGTRVCKASGLWDACKDWVICPAGEKCVDQKCVTDCPDSPCNPGDRQCTTKGNSLPGKYLLCVKNSKGCYEWDNKESSCSADEICDQGQCAPYKCPKAECSEGDLRCPDANSSQRCIKDKFGCLAWGDVQPCAKEQRCQSSTGLCSVCEPKKQESCYTGTKGEGIGECKAGTRTCADDGSKWSACTGEILPTQDVCNKKDDDCDGLTDEDCDCEPGKTQPCGTDTGECKKGTQTCGQDGKWGPCSGDTRPTTERCNGKDDDCDGQIDEDFTDKGKACSAGQGECKATGTYVCKADGSGLECSAKASSPSAETCDGKDNDCDGAIDEDFPTKGNSCNVGQGECKASGTFVCKADGSGLECSAQAGTASPEVCNGKDDDCDGQTDEDFGTKGQACSVGQGECQRSGTWGCKSDGSGLACSSQPGAPAPERCDGKDNDCDGSIDEDFAQKGSACSVGIGACKASGSYICKADGSNLECSAKANAPAPELCDGKDNDCDGLSDEDFNQKGQACSVGIGECKASGTYTCKADGSGLVCNATPAAPSAERCDGKDNDCDGLSDEDFAQNGQACTVGQGECQRSGTYACKADGSGLSCSATAGSPAAEACDNKDNDCDGMVDEGLTRACTYTGPSGTEGVGVCKAGSQGCAGGSWGICAGQVTPSPENCTNGLDDDCNGQVDDCSTALTITSYINTITGQIDGTVPAGWKGNGRFELTGDIKVPAGVTIDIRGSNPLQLTTTGKIEILGTLDLAGVAGKSSNCSSSLPGLGGSSNNGGGSVGGGGGTCNTAGTQPGAPDGSGTNPGKGGAAGNYANAGGGGGAGHASKGGDGLPVSIGGTGGAAWGSATALNPGGGGGGGVCGYFFDGLFEQIWTPGAGGGAGGGAVLLESTTGDIIISGVINAFGGAGGSAPTCTGFFGGASTGGGGGGGAGGTIRLRAKGTLLIQSGASLNARGGAGNGQAATKGGDGSAGRIRLEDGDGAVLTTGATVQPAPTIATY